MVKSRTIAVVYGCARNSQRLIQYRSKMQRRLQRAIEDMVEDGFDTFLLPIDEGNPFVEIFIDAFMREKVHILNIQLVVMLPYEVEECFNTPPDKRLSAYTQYADQVIYNHSHESVLNVWNSPEKLFDLSNARIIFFENNCSRVNFVTHHALENRLPMIYVNI